MNHSICEKTERERVSVELDWANASLVLGTYPDP